MTELDGLLLVIGVLLLWVARKRWLRRLPRAPVKFAGRGWTWDQLCQGIMVFGGIGSGKSFSTEDLLRQMIAAGCPMLVASVKPDEYVRYEKLCRELDCLDRLVLINDTSRDADGRLYSLNFLDEILKTSSPADAASFLMDMGQAGGGDKGGENAFWRNQEHASYRYAIRLAELAYGKASVKIVYDLIRSTPNSRADAVSGTEKKLPSGATKIHGYFDFDDLHPQAGAFAKAMHEVVVKDVHMGEFNRIQAFFMTELPATEKIRGSVIAGVMGTLGRLVDPPWLDLLAETTLSPEIIQRDRKIVVVDMPVMIHHEPARLFNSLWVMMAQRYLMQRDARGFVQPFIIARDEAGWVLSSEWDSKAHNVLRQQKCCSFAVCQCLDTLKASLGGTPKSELEAMAFASQHMHKFGFANYSKSTNDWFSEIAGQVKRIMPSGGNQPIPHDACAEALGCNSVGWSMAWEPLIRPEAFTRLPVGHAYMLSGGNVDYVNFRRKR